MLKMLLMLECDCCSRTLPYIHLSSIEEIEEWEDWRDWAQQLPRHAERFLQWKIEEDMHECPECLYARGELGDEQCETQSD